MSHFPNPDLRLPMPWGLTGIVSAGLIGLSVFWIAIILCNYDVAMDPAADSLTWDVAAVALALTHIVLLGVAVLWRWQWGADAVITLLALESLLLVIACFDPALLLVGLAVYTVTLYSAMCYWRYKAFNYPSFFIFLEFLGGCIGRKP